jgi:cytochrome c oxidase subunit II
MFSKRLSVLCTGLIAALGSAFSHGAYDVNIPPPNTSIAHEIYGLHMYILYICLGIFIVVFGAMFWSLLKHRKSVGHKAAHFHEHVGVEIAWTIIPFIILALIAVPATKTVLAMKDASNPDMTVKVTGYQWKWEYDYPQEGVKFYSSLKTPRDQIGTPEAHATAEKNPDYLLEVDNPLVVPAGKKVRLLVTSNDVIHGWYMPNLGVNQYGIPGFIKDAWVKIDKPGIYKGQCSQICGKEHGYMPITVEAKDDAGYAAWVAEQKKKMAALQDDPNKVWSLDELKAKGQQVYSANCAACHQANGAGVPGAFPALTGSKVATGPIAGHVNIVLNGKTGTAMAAFGKQLSDTDIAAVVTFERNGLGNQVGDMVLPKDILAARSGVAVADTAPVTPATAAPVAAATKAEAADTGAAAGMPAKIFFAKGKAELPSDAEKAIATAVEYLKASASAKVNITAYTDKSGSLETNLELAKQRAVAVRAALQSAGGVPERINMKPPESVTAGADANARRVEINPAN